MDSRSEDFLNGSPVTAGELRKITTQYFKDCYPIAMGIPEHGSTAVLSFLASNDLIQVLQRHLFFVLSSAEFVDYESLDMSLDEFNSCLVWFETLRSDILQEWRVRYPKDVDITPAFKTPSPIEAKPGYIYLLKAITPDTYYKIGLSKNAVGRIESLSVKLPFPIEPLHQFPTNHRFKAEKILHERYADKRVNGEWFQLSAQDVVDICAIGHMDIEGVQS